MLVSDCSFFHIGEWLARLYSAHLFFDMMDSNKPMSFLELHTVQSVEQTLAHVHIDLKFLLDNHIYVGHCHIKRLFIQDFVENNQMNFICWLEGEVGMTEDWEARKSLPSI